MHTINHSLNHDAHLQGALSADTVYMELLQVTEIQEFGDKPRVVVAKFKTS